MLSMVYCICSRLVMCPSCCEGNAKPLMGIHLQYCNALPQGRCGKPGGFFCQSEWNGKGKNRLDEHVKNVCTLYSEFEPRREQ